jgi:large subunit ribosomal protein L24
MKIHKGDEVYVLAGKFRGERANVEEALPGANKVILDGLNIAKRHTKQAGSTMQAGIIDKLMPLDASNVAVWCDGHKGPAKIGYKTDDDGVKHRVCRKCGVTL